MLFNFVNKGKDTFCPIKIKTIRVTCCSGSYDMSVSCDVSDVNLVSVSRNCCTVYPKKYAHGFCFAVLCCGYTLTDFPISISLTSLALWQSNDCPSASKATLMNMDKYFMWIHYERLHNHNKAKHNKTVCIFLGIYCMVILSNYALIALYVNMYSGQNKYCTASSMCVLIWFDIYVVVNCIKGLRML